MAAQIVDHRAHLAEAAADRADTSATSVSFSSSVSSPSSWQIRRRRRRLRSDTVVVPAREGGFKRTFLGKHRWYAIRIGAAMKERIKYIAAYQVAPISAVTHVAEVREIQPYQDSGKYEVIFAGPATEIEPVPIRDAKNSPQGPVYVRQEDLVNAEYLEDALTAGS